MLEESRQNPDVFRGLLQQFGYADQLQYERVKRTFGRMLTER